MKYLFPCLLAIVFMTSCNQPKQETKEEPGTKPNILLIVADDLGYSDIEPFGGNIKTPVLGKLAGEGMLFSNFHVLPTCSPSRSALLTGNDNHVAGLGIMHELDYPALHEQQLPGYAGHLNNQVITIPEVLRENGYHTYMSGKWHLGEDAGQTPHDRGFEECFTLLNGGGSHFADKKALSPQQHMTYLRNDQEVEQLPADFYSTKNYTDSLLAFIDRKKGDGKPFFAYLSYTAVHDPLQAPEDYIKKYHGKFDMGWDSLRTMRLNNLKALGLVPQEVNSFFPNPVIPKWDKLPKKMQEEFARDMEVYAAMLDYMDMSIGRVFDYLKQNNLYDNTMIVFFSDNGANGAMATSYPGNGDGKYLGTFDNGMENRGLLNSYVEMGPGWAQASSSPFRLFKTFTTEGGIKSPMIIKMPGAASNKGQWNHSFIHITDFMPTLFELAGVAAPAAYKGNAVRQPIGKSFLPVLNGTAQSIHEQDGMGYELFEMKAYIKGKWKILRLPVPFSTGEWQLYDLEKDPGETSDLSAQYPEIKKELIQAWQDYALANQLYDHKGHYDTIYRQSYSAIGDE